MGSSAAGKVHSIGHRSEPQGHAYGALPARMGTGTAPPVSDQTMKDLQAQERRQALLKVQAFLNPDNKPPAKTAAAAKASSTGSGKTTDENADSRKSKDDK